MPHHRPAVDRQPHEIQPRADALPHVIRQIPRQHVPACRQRSVAEVTHHAPCHVEHLGRDLGFLRQRVIQLGRRPRRVRMRRSERNLRRKLTRLLLSRLDAGRNQRRRELVAARDVQLQVAVEDRHRILRSGLAVHIDQHDGRPGRIRQIRVDTEEVPILLGFVRLAQAAGLVTILVVTIEEHRQALLARDPGDVARAMELDEVERRLRRVRARRNPRHVAAREHRDQLTLEVCPGHHVAVVPVAAAGRRRAAARIDHATVAVQMAIVVDGLTSAREPALASAADGGTGSSHVTVRSAEAHHASVVHARGRADVERHVEFDRARGATLGQSAQRPGEQATRHHR